MESESHTRRTVAVSGCEIHVRTRGTEGQPLLLLHGGGGSTQWWNPVLEHLDPARRVVLMDLSGHGLSGRRADYAIPQWSDEVAAVIDAEADGQAVIVGHSMGGRVGTMTAARYPDAVAALVIVDSAVPMEPGTRLPGSRPKRIYASREEAEAAFHLLPAQPEPTPAVMDPLRASSVVEDEDGWTWRFAPNVFARLREQDAEQSIDAIRCPVVAIHGEHSDVTTPALVTAFAERLGRPVPLVTLPGAHHHLLLDDPAGLATLLQWLPETAATTDD